MTQIVTINTDASFHAVHKVGAYAFWIVFQGQRLIQSGPLKACLSAHDAEIQAIANALHALLKTTAFKEVKMIIINTDCKHAIKALRDKDKKFYNGADFAIAKVHDTIKKLREKYNPGPRKHRNVSFISWRWVKAHTAGETARLWVNNYCDKAAKEALWASIKEKELKKTRE